MARNLGLALLTLGVLMALVAALPAGATHQDSLNGCTSKQDQAGTLTSPPYDLSSAPSTVNLKFEYWWEIESVDPEGHDLMTVELFKPGEFGDVPIGTPIKLNPVYDDVENPKPAGKSSWPISNVGVRIPPVWASFSAAVPEAALEPDVRVRFSFGSLDNLYNGFRGWGVDDVRFEASAEPGPPVGGLEADFEFNPDISGDQPAFPPGWDATGSWNRPASPEKTAIASDIQTNLIELGDGDSGVLPTDPSGGTYAWFGEEATGTFCGADYAKDLTPSPSFNNVVVGDQVAITVSGEGLAAGARLLWSTAGANDRGTQIADFDSGNPAQTTISYTGQAAGFDTISMFADENSNGVQDPGELSAEAYVIWEGLSVSPTSASRTLGETQALAAQVASGSTGAPVVWSVSGANPQAPQSLMPNSEGRSDFAYAGSSAGSDTVQAFLDTDGSGTRDSGEPSATSVITWSAAPPPPQPGLALDPANASPTIGTPHTITATATNGSGTVRFSVSGANTASAAVPVDPATGRASFTYTGERPGPDTVSAHLDIDGGGGMDGGEPTAGAAVNWRNRSNLPPDILTADRIEDLPNPQPFRETNVAPAGGSVLVQLGGSGGASAAQALDKPFIPLESAAQIPVGSVLNTNQGRAQVEAAADKAGRRTSSSQFYSGTFRVTQPRARTPVTEMVMQGGSFRACSRSKSRRPAGKSQRRRTVRRLWGSGRGRFRTRGRYSSATVRGTRWLVEDRCDGTLTRVLSGNVQVRDFPRRRTVSVRAGRSYFADRRPAQNLRKR